MATQPHREVVREINAAIATLVEAGLADDQNNAYESKTGPDTFIVRYSNVATFGKALRDRPYEEMYWEFRQARSFNLLMLDGAMLQMVYEFVGGELVRHRLAFLPSPSLLDFQNDPDLYLEELMYADVVEKGVVTVPLRFDYDGRDGVAIELDHPLSHLTLGQYSGCRIPVTAGVTPHAFVDFVLRGFYKSAASSIGAELAAPVLRFPECIGAGERRVVHVGIPTHT